MTQTDLLRGEWGRTLPPTPTSYGSDLFPLLHL